MSTFQTKRKQFFRIRKWAGLSISIPILVIAFVVKGHAFENESDILRQALRQQQEVLSAVDRDKLLLGKLKRHEIRINPGVYEKRGISCYEFFRDVIEQSLRWIGNNNRENKIIGIFIPGLLKERSKSPKNILAEGFIPFGAIIFYQEK